VLCRTKKFVSILERRTKKFESVDVNTEGAMTGNELLKRLNKYAKARGLEVRFMARRGKGSHGTVYLGTETRRTTVKDRKKEIGGGLPKSMLADLGINPEDF